MATNYVDDLMVNMSDTGMTPDLQQLVYDDAARMSDLGVGNDRERNLLFYLDNFCDDLCHEFGYPKIGDRKNVVSVSFKNLKSTNDIDLTKIREAVFMALKQLFKHKLAYPNTMGVHESNAKTRRDVNKWVKALGEIYASMRGGESREDASKRIMEEWTPMEKLDFRAWSKYYEAKDHEKYGVTVTAAPLEVPTLAPRVMPPLETLTPKAVKQKKEKTQRDIKEALISRFNAAERLLYKFRLALTTSSYNRLHQALSDLKREVMMVNTASMISDCIIRTANIWERGGFSEGAEVLKKIAAPPGDLASQIDQALSGREYDSKPDADLASEELGGLGDMGGESMPPPEEMEGMEPPAGAGDELPASEEPPSVTEEEPIEQEPIEEPKDDDNPFSGKTVQDVLEVLEPLSRELSERRFVRGLAKADMMLDSMNIASHFPELGEAIAKALELNIYVGTRLNKVVEKLKGGLKEEKTAPPNVDLEELTEKKPIEEEVFEVKE